MSTIEKTARRIMQTATTLDLDVKAATTRAAWDALQEARELGWTERAQAGLVATFAAVGVELAVMVSA